MTEQKNGLCTKPIEASSYCGGEGQDFPKALNKGKVLEGIYYMPKETITGVYEEAPRFNAGEDVTASALTVDEFGA